VTEALGYLVLAGVAGLLCWTSAGRALLDEAGARVDRWIA
jgi:hypothetical protein